MYYFVGAIIASVLHYRKGFVGGGKYQKSASDKFFPQISGSDSFLIAQIDCDKKRRNCLKMH